MPRRIFERYYECAQYRALRIRLDPIEGHVVWRHDFYANSPLARLPPGERPYDGYVIVDVDTGQDIGLVLRGRYAMKIPFGEGRPEDGVDRLPASRLWIPVHARCEADIACQMQWEALLRVVDPIRLKGATRRPLPPMQPPLDLSDEDTDALAGIEAW